MGIAENEVDALAARVKDGSRLFGPWRQRRAIQRLAAVPTASSAAALATIYMRDLDEGARQIVENALLGLSDQACVDAVCDVAVQTGNDQILALIDKTGHLPSSPERQALLLFLTGRFDEYAELDVSGRMLRTAHALADEPLRARLADRARAAGRMEWVRAVTDALGDGSVTALADTEWEAVIDISVTSGAWKELWRLVTTAPAKWGVRVLHALDRQKWKPTSETEGKKLSELVKLARPINAEMGDDFVPADLTIVPGRTNIQRLTVTADGELLCASVDGGIQLWSLPSGEPAGDIAGGEYAARHLAVTPDSGLLLSDNTKARLIPDGHRYLWDGQIGLWQLPSGTSAGTLRGEKHAMRCMALTPDGGIVAAGDDHGRVNLWHLPSGKPAGVLTVSNLPLVCMTVTADSKLLICGDAGGAISLWALGSGRPVCFLRNRQRLLTKMVTSPDGRWLVTYSVVGSVWTWDLLAQQKVATLGGEHYARDIAMTSDGRLLAVGTARGIDLWHLPTGESVGMLSTGSLGAKDITMIPGTALVAACGRDATVRLWDLVTGKGAGVLPGSEGLVDHVVVTSDGKLIAAASSHGTIRLWRLWRPEVRRLSHLPIGELEATTIDQLRRSKGEQLAGEHAWLDFMAALLRWRHQHNN